MDEPINSHNKPFVLIVDDDADTCDVFRATLDLEGFHAVCALTRESAVAILEAARPDLLLVDIRMGEMTLEEFSSRISKLNPPPPVVVISAGTPAEIESAAKLLKADSILTKPFGMDVVIAEAKRLTAGAEERATSAVRRSS